MSVIAWDGKTLAADKMGVTAEMPVRLTKIWRLKDGMIAASCGGTDVGQALLHWYQNGADPAKWPDCQRDNDRWARLIVASPAGVVIYEREPYPLPVEDDFIAWGSGRDFAMAAMAMGATAREAVELASRLCVSCGFGVDAFDVHVHHDLEVVR